MLSNCFIVVHSYAQFKQIIESRDKSEDQDADSPCDAVRVSVLVMILPIYDYFNSYHNIL